jgi:hypothetical protein
MSAERSIATQEKQLEQFPPELRNLSDWCWYAVRPALEGTCRQLGFPPLTAAATAARVARMVASQIYTDLKILRQATTAPGAVFVFALLVLAPALAAAQTLPAPRPISFAWEAPDSAATLAEAQALVYKLYDKLTPTVPITVKHTCTGTARPFACSSEPLSFGVGTHEFTLTATNEFGESTRSNPVAAGPTGPPKGLKLVVTVQVTVP